jgi:hypothetical protein
VRDDLLPGQQHPDVHRHRLGDPVAVPDALAPVHCELVHDHAAYVEANRQVHHVRRAL